MLKNKHQIMLLLLIVVLVSLIPVEVFATSSNLDTQIDELELLLDSLYQEKANIEESVDVIKPIKSSTPTELDFEIQLLEVQKSNLEDKFDNLTESKVNEYVSKERSLLKFIMLVVVFSLIFLYAFSHTDDDMSPSSTIALAIFGGITLAFVLIPSISNLEIRAHSYIESEVSEHFYRHQNQNMVTTFFVENHSDMKIRKVVALEQEVKMLDSKIDFLQNLELKPKNANKK